MPMLRPLPMFCLLIAGMVASPLFAEPPLGLDSSWRKSSRGGAHESFAIRGTGDRNNPLRRQLLQAFDGDELFVHFRLTYSAASIDREGDGDGEFFVCWLDDNDGGDAASHASGVPNIGLHVADGQNRFMIRYHAGGQSFSEIQLKGDREYRIAARLSKSASGPEQAFDRLDLWVDPAYYDLSSPDASATYAKAIKRIEWFGFATGRKTEPDDRIQVSDIRLALSWREMLGLAPATEIPDRVQPGDLPDLPRQENTVSFTEDVFPILDQHCFQCHRGRESESGLRLDVVDEVFNQISPGNGRASHLIRVISSNDDETRMPPPGDDRRRLDRSEIETLVAWIDEGLQWDSQRFPVPAPTSKHWAFQPIRRPEVPTTGSASWVRTSVDAFIARQHEALGLVASPPASAETLLRRISLDLTGLPPNVTHGAAHRDGDANESADQLVEKLLSSLEYGQRYGRHWLDLARYGESNGYQHNRNRPYAWRYRDYVIDSFRHDRPVDEFIRQQIAGDEMEFGRENLVATGFLAAARYSGNELDEEIQRNDILVDVVNTTSKAMLGLTLECAQCHAHKFDPFSIRDYYALQAFFAEGQPGNLVLEADSEQAARLVAARWEMFDDVQARMVKSRREKDYPEPILVIPKSVLAGMKGVEKELFQQIEREIALLPQSWGWHAPSTARSPIVVAPHEMRWPLPRDRSAWSWRSLIRIRGDVKSRGPEVVPAWPALFGPTPDDLPSPRTALADWLTSTDNPLTARVWVNRIWQWHFGRGLVESSGDFGTQGTPPTHPELLDFLAAELIDSGWSTRHVHRLILGSSTYRQSARVSQSNDAIDPGNDYLWRWRPRRLEAEAIRDSILSVAGRLDHTEGGPSVPARQTKTSRRRSVYLEQKRDKLPEALKLFDAPDAVKVCSRRNVSTVSLQPLYLLNSEFIGDMAAGLAERVRDGADDPTEFPRVAIRLVLGREADREELDRSSEFLAQNSLESYCRVLLNLNEFLYIN